MTFTHSFNQWPGFNDPLVIAVVVVVALAAAALVGSLIFRNNKKLKESFLFGAFFAFSAAIVITILFILMGGAFEKRSTFIEKIELTYGIELNKASAKQFFNSNKSYVPTVDVPLNVTLEFEGKRYVTSVVVEELSHDEWRLLSPSSSLAELTPLEDLLASGAQELRVFAAE